MTRVGGRGSSGWQRRIAALLLVVQATAGSTVTLAHAAETRSGPVSIEAHHTAQCVVLHDTARCVQCQFSATRMVPAASRPRSFGGALGCLHSLPVQDAGPASRQTSTTRSRAPPPLLS